MTQDELKEKVAQAAVAYVVPGAVLGVGSGSTAERFIEALRPLAAKIPAAVASSERTAAKLRGIGVEVRDLNDVTEIPVYVDGADEIDASMAMIKGGGGALTREKIVAAAARRFVCIADGSKLVDTLGRFPLPVEVIPMAREYVARELRRRGGEPKLRAGFTTDNGNVILDVSGFSIADPVGLETDINGIAGVVTNGLFARRGADVLLLGTAAGVRTVTRG